MLVRTSLFILVSIVTTSCASLSNRSTHDLIAAERNKERKIVKFASSKSVAAIENGIISNSCGRETVQTDILVRAAPGTFVPVSSSGKFSVESGSAGAGRWVGLRMDGGLHLLASGVELQPRQDGGTDVSVFVANKRKVDLIKQHVEDGTLFCHWREISYPYD